MSGSVRVAGVHVGLAVEPSAPAEALGELLRFPRGSGAGDLRWTAAAVPPGLADLADLGAHFGPFRLLGGAGGALGLAAAGAAARWDPASSRVVVGGSDPRALELCARLALALALQALGRHHLHAALVEVPPLGGVVIAGGSGAGKTTLALALLRLPGAGWATDDTVFLERGAEGLRLHGVPAEFHVAPDTLAVVGEAGPALGRALARQPQKRALEVRELYGGAERTRPLAPSCLLFPEVGAGETSVVRLSPPEALTRLYRSALFALVDVPGAAGHRETLAALAGASRAFAVALGPELLAGPDPVVTRLVGAIAAPGSG